jgi:hypothetical protein
MSLILDFRDVFKLRLILKVIFKHRSSRVIIYYDNRSEYKLYSRCHQVVVTYFVINSISVSMSDHFLLSKDLRKHLKIYTISAGECDCYHIM